MISSYHKLGGNTSILKHRQYTGYWIPLGNIADVKSSDYDAGLFVYESYLFEGPDVSTIPDRESGMKPLSPCKLSGCRPEPTF